MSPAAFRAAVDRVSDLTRDVREIEFALQDPKEIAFKAGQYISFELLSPRTGRPVIRPYSIASAPRQTDRVTLLFNRVPGGIGSTYLFGLSPGEKVRFTGPSGEFHLHDRSRHSLFVATGTGIAPIHSMLLDLLEDGGAADVRLFWGLRTPLDLFYQHEFDSLARRHPRFVPVTTLTQPDATWTGPVGRVTKLVEERVTSVKNLAVYLCGNHAMITDVTRLVQAKGLCPIYREIYYDDPPEHPDY